MLPAFAARTCIQSKPFLTALRGMRCPIPAQNHLNYRTYALHYFPRCVDCQSAFATPAVNRLCLLMAAPASDQTQSQPIGWVIALLSMVWLEHWPALACSCGGVSATPPTQPHVDTSDKTVGISRCTTTTSGSCVLPRPAAIPIRQSLSHATGWHQTQNENCASQATPRHTTDILLFSHLVGLP